MISFCKQMHKILPLMFGVLILTLCGSRELYSQTEPLSSRARQDSLHHVVAPADSVHAPIKNKDPWLGVDKMHHLSISAFLVGSQMYVYREHASMDDARALRLAVSTTLLLGIGKELYDGVSGKGTASFKDLLADLAGIALAASIFMIE